MIAAESEANLKKTILDLIKKKSKDIGLIINKNQTKYMILLHKNHNQMEFVVDQLRFVRVETFEYL